MLDIRQIRENPDATKTRLRTRGADHDADIDALLQIDADRRRAETDLQQLQADRKRLSKQIGSLRAQGQDTADIEAQVKSLADDLSALSAAATDADTRQRDLLLGLPNLPQRSVPPGRTEADNPVLRHHGEKPTAATGEDHLAIGTRLGLFDFERAAKLSGSAFVCYTGPGARLERALVNFLLDLHTTQHGYTEISPPLLVRPECLVGTTQLPKFADQVYHCPEDDLYLVPTAEVPVTNLHRDEIVPLADLPLAYTAYTPCFRREAGAAGLGTRGIIRLHQFDKVELVRITTPEDSAAALELITSQAERVLQLLDLHYRVIELCTGDLGFGSAKTYDIEVWAPGQNAYLEVSSCSNFDDFQARRMNLRYKNAEGKNQFCHTLNGSGTALARLYVALLETHVQPDGSITIPEPLQQYFGASRIS